MTIGERINKIIHIKGLKKVEFASAVNIDQSYVTKIIKGTSQASSRLKNDICREFGVRLEWLETGEGEMYINHDESIIEQLSAEYKLTPLTREFIEYFLKLPPEVRELVAKAVHQAARLYPRDKVPRGNVIQIKPDDELTTEEAMEVIRQEWEDKKAAQKREITMSSAFTGANGSSSKKFINGT